MHLHSTLNRLSVIIQNLPLLLVERTSDREFNHSLLRLFRRYFTVCKLLKNVNKAQTAWRCLHETSQDNVLEDASIFQDYLFTMFEKQLNDLEGFVRPMPQSDKAKENWQACLEMVECVSDSTTQFLL